MLKTSKFEDDLFNKKEQFGVCPVFVGLGSGLLSGRDGNLVQGFLALLLGGFGSVPVGTGPAFGFACTPNRVQTTVVETTVVQTTVVQTTVVQTTVQSGTT